MLPADATSLRDHDAEEWLQVLGWTNPRTVARRFLVDTVRWLDDLAVGTGWDAEFDRDVWRLRRLGFATRDATIRFDKIGPEWLRSLTKRWARWRLSTGVHRTTVATGVNAVTLMASSFPQLRRGPQALTRDLLERHLAQLALKYAKPKTRQSHISAINGLLTTARQHDWEPRLSPSAQLYREDNQRREEPLPRFLSEAVMVQLEDPANLARFEDPTGRLLARILMATGLRISDGAGLAIDCLIRDAQGAPYLRYRNHKMFRDAVVPIDDELAVAIESHQQDVISRLPAAEFLLLRETRNPTGRLGYSPDTFRHRLYRWLADCDIRDELGRPVHVTPHQWRHTYATRLINADVPQEVVRRLLDHTSHEMTSRYARLSDHTIRQKWENARSTSRAARSHQRRANWPMPSG